MDINSSGAWLARFRIWPGPARSAIWVICLLAFATVIQANTAVSNDLDPLETSNRAMHNLNIGIDRVFFRPVSRAYGTIMPEPAIAGIGNVASNLRIPGIIINNILQLQMGDALSNSARFLVNSTFGIYGLLDPASEMGFELRETDFGETLHRAGVGGGSYMVLPLIGPRNQRDLIGLAVDLYIDPINHLLPKTGVQTAVTIRFLNVIGERYQNADLIDSIFYDSEDSYIELKLYYTQNRRYELEGGTSIEYIDPYELFIE